MSLIPLQSVVGLSPTSYGAIRDWLQFNAQQQQLRAQAKYQTTLLQAQQRQRQTDALSDAFGRIGQAYGQLGIERRAVAREDKRYKRELELEQKRYDRTLDREEVRSQRAHERGLIAQQNAADLRMYGRPTEDIEKTPGLRENLESQRQQEFRTRYSGQSASDKMALDLYRAKLAVKEKAAKDPTLEMHYPLLDEFDRLLPGRVSGILADESMDPMRKANKITELIASRDRYDFPMLRKKPAAQLQAEQMMKPEVQLKAQRQYNESGWLQIQDFKGKNPVWKSAIQPNEVQDNISARIKSISDYYKDSLGELPSYEEISRQAAQEIYGELQRQGYYRPPQAQPPQGGNGAQRFLQGMKQQGAEQMQRAQQYLQQNRGRWQDMTTQERQQYTDYENQLLQAGIQPPKTTQRGRQPVKQTEKRPTQESEKYVQALEEMDAVQSARRLSFNPIVGGSNRLPSPGTTQVIEDYETKIKTGKIPRLIRLPQISITALRKLPPELSFYKDLPDGRHYYKVVNGELAEIPPVVTEEE